MAAPTMRGGKKMRERLERIKGDLAEKSQVHVGFLAGATYPDGTSVAQVAFWNEYGHVHRDAEGNIKFEVPPRPFFRRAIAANSKFWGVQLARQLRITDYHTALAFGRMGELIAGQIAESISIFNAPVLALSTVNRKGSEKPLVETGHMLASISYEVE